MFDSHEHQELQRTLRRFIESEINPHVDEWEEAGIFPAHALFRKMEERLWAAANAVQTPANCIDLAVEWARGRAMPKKEKQ